MHIVNVFLSYDTMGIRTSRYVFLFFFCPRRIGLFWGNLLIQEKTIIVPSLETVSPLKRRETIFENKRLSTIPLPGENPFRGGVKQR